MLDKLGAAVKTLIADLKGVKADVNRLKISPVPKDGKPGKDAVAPAMADIVSAVLDNIRVPKDGKDAEVDGDAIAFKVLSHIKKPKDGKDAVAPAMADIINAVLAEMPKAKDGHSPEVGPIIKEVLAQMPAPEVVHALEAPATAAAKPGKDGVSVTKVKLEKGNQLAVWLDGVRRVVGKIEIPKTVESFTPGGGGGGASKKSQPFYEKQVVVRKPSELSGQLRSDVLYFLDGVIDFTGTGLNIEVPEGGLSLTGHTFDVSGVKCTDAGYTLFTSPAGGSGNLLGQDYFVEVSGTSSEVYRITDATGFNAFEFSRVNYNNCTSLGEIEGYRQGLETGTGRFGGKPELTLSGTWLGGFFIDTSIVRSLEDGVYSLFKAGAAFTMASRFRSNQNIDLPASASFLDFSPANFTNPSTVQLVGCQVSRDGVVNSSDPNITPNLSPGDLASEWSFNNGISNTFVGGELFISTEAETTISTVDVFEDLAGTYTARDLQHFDEPANGQLRHLGDSPVEYSVNGQVVIAGGSNDLVDLKVVVFRAGTSTFEDGKTVRRVINNLAGSRNVGYFTVSDKITLNKNDYVKLQVANASGVTNVTSELDSFMRVSAR
jgi:hypothetical protein